MLAQPGRRCRRRRDGAPGERHRLVVDPALRHAAGPTVAAPGAHLFVTGSTLLGEVGCRTLDVTSCICDGTVTVVDRQVGCARFSYLAPGSRAPRRFRCVPPSDAETGDAPSYVDTTPGSPFYPALAPSAPVSLRRGGEFEAEMGVHHHLRRPPRMDAARRLVAPYVPAGCRSECSGADHARRLHSLDPRPRTRLPVGAPAAGAGAARRRVERADVDHRPPRRGARSRHRRTRGRSGSRSTEGPVRSPRRPRGRVRSGGRRRGRGSG